ncbi:MAG: hypothetical protein WKF85_14495 [Chitinophagaceae bacterium]
MKAHLFLGILLSCLFFSCKKQTVICTGNCYTLNVTGKVVNALTNTNAPNVPLIINQVKFVGLLSSSKTVQEFSSKNDGTFSASPSIDTTMFQNGYFLTLKVKDNNDYMTLPDRGSNNRLYDLTTNPFVNMNIFVYPKVNLTIKLNRNQNDNFQYFAVSYFFVENEEFFPFSILSPQGINKSELIVPTSADSSGVSTATLDSIKCVKGGTNVYTVNF